MTPRYKLRTLLVLLAILPPVLWFAWAKYVQWRRGRRLAEIEPKVREVSAELNKWMKAQPSPMRDAEIERLTEQIFVLRDVDGKRAALIERYRREGEAATLNRP